MSFELPPVMEPAALADRCREVAGREQVEPSLVEKDYYLTRLLGALGQHFGDRLLLKGGTLLSKVDLGFLRMSEDADFVIPEAPSRNKGTNIKRVNIVRDALKRIEAQVGVKRRFPSGDDSDGGAHRRWQLDYDSQFGPQSILLEVSLRPVLRPPRNVRLAQLLGPTEARCWALDEDEARAEKMRAACTREAIRDYYDLDRLLDAGKDLSSISFCGIVDAKLAELAAPPMREHVRVFNLDARRLKLLRHGLRAELPAVLRLNAPPFDLDAMLARFEALLRSPQV